MRFFIAVYLLFIGWTAWLLLGQEVSLIRRPQTHTGIQKSEIAKAVESSLQQGIFPSEIPWAASVDGKMLARYTLDFGMQERIEKLLKSYKPDYSAFVAVDAATGRVLSLISYSRVSSDIGNLALKATFPAASVFKIVTAAAAIDQNKANPDTVITFHGGNHTLYRRNLTKLDEDRWIRRMTLREAFAKSVNTVFGKIGAFVLNPFQIREYAKRFKFNEAFETDLPVEKGSFALVGNDAMSLAEVASGYNRLNQMSPLQGAMIAAAIANDGLMMDPYFVDYLFTQDGRLMYHGETREGKIAVTKDSARELRQLMRETVIRGTSRHSFRDLIRRQPYFDMDIGGKTGSLMGYFPKGKVDWFVGYARQGERKIALAALTVNEESWRVKASFIARSFIEEYFSPRRAVQ